MPQPDSSRNRAQDIRWNGVARNEGDHPWPVDPAAPARRASARRNPPSRRTPDPLKDGRTPDDKDGNEELEREQDKPSSQRPTSDRQAGMQRTHSDFETEETGEWVATERFTLEDELEDTWPNVPARYLEQ